MKSLLDGRWEFSREEKKKKRSGCCAAEAGSQGLQPQTNMEL